MYSYLNSPNSLDNFMDTHGPQVVQKRDWVNHNSMDKNGVRVAEIYRYKILNIGREFNLINSR